MNSPDVRSWIAVSGDSDFPIQNLPYGVFSAAGRGDRIGVAIGDRILDVHAVALAGLFDGIIDSAVLLASVLNPLLACDPRDWRALRGRLIELLREDSATLRDREDRARYFVAADDATMRLPFSVGDYVDFYSSIEHATNLGKILRPNSEPLLENWRWIPIGYHGRSSTVIVDGTPIVRPSGQRKPPDAKEPSFGPSAALDIELEIGFVTGAGNRLGEPIPIASARDHIFGLVIVNDWSARDIQAWEYQPLGPFLGKSFATSISPWVVTLEALEPYRTKGPRQEPAPLPYLQGGGDCNYDIELEVRLQTAKMRGAQAGGDVIARTNYRAVYWNMAQQLAHVASNGTAVRPGDLYASGTISGAEGSAYGSLIELTWRGARPIRLSTGETRAFLEDGDSVEMRAWCKGQGRQRIGFGAVRGLVTSGF